MSRETQKFFTRRSAERLLCGVFALAAFPVLAANLWLKLNWLDWIAYGGLMGLAGTLADLAKGPCPGCGNPFGGNRLPFARECQHCGLTEDRGAG